MRKEEFRWLLRNRLYSCFHWNTPLLSSADICWYKLAFRGHWRMVFLSVGNFPVTRTLVLMELLLSDWPMDIFAPSPLLWFFFLPQEAVHVFRPRSNYSFLTTRHKEMWTTKQRNSMVWSIPPLVLSQIHTVASKLADARYIPLGDQSTETERRKLNSPV